MSYYKYGYKIAEKDNDLNNIFEKLTNKQKDVIENYKALLNFKNTSPNLFHNEINVHLQNLKKYFENKIQNIEQQIIILNNLLKSLENNNDNKEINNDINKIVLKLDILNTNLNNYRAIIY